MGLFRQINSTLKSAMFAINSVIKNKETQGRNSIKMMTSLTIFATSVVGLGASLVNKARRKINSSGGGSNKGYSGKTTNSSGGSNNKKPKSTKNTNPLRKPTYDSGGKSKSQIKREELAELLTQQAIDGQKNLPKSETISSPDFFKKKNEYDMPPAFYDVYIDLKNNWEDYIAGISEPEIEYTGKSFEVTLFKNTSKIVWEEYVTGKINGKDALEYSPDERAKIMSKYTLDKTIDFKKQNIITISPHGLFNEDGFNYMEECEDDSEILSRLSVDYGKIYMPFFNHLLYLTRMLMRRGYL